MRKRRRNSSAETVMIFCLPRVFPAKGNPITLKGNQAMAGNGDAMGIAGNIVENVLGTAEGRLKAFSNLL